MLIFICPNCSRFGAIPTPKEASKIACPHCKEADIDWLGRPDLEDPKGKGVFIDGLMRSIESLTMQTLATAYKRYDDKRASATNTIALLESCESVLRDLLVKMK